MKRVGFLFSQILERENLLSAFAKASQGKSLRQDRIAFAERLEENLAALAEGMRDFSYPIGKYKRFLIFDPKEREICAAAFSERVLHHAIMNVSGCYFDKALIADSYANRKGKGQIKAVMRARKYASENRWFMKCDIRKYFDSISHILLYDKLVRKFKDPMLLKWFEKLISSYEKTAGRGLPIGNLTSQYFANLYLDGVDRLYSPYVRYMDDFIFWANDKQTLLSLRTKITAYVKDVLSLELKQLPYINRTSSGMDFLGYRVFPNDVRLSRATARRYVSRVKGISKYVDDEYVVQNRLTSMTAFIKHAETDEWRRLKLKRYFM